MVDDDADMRRLLSLVFSHAGAHAVAANGVLAALERFEKLQPQLLVSDLELPQRDGLELIRCIRSLPAHQGGGVPAIVLTGASGGDVRRKATSAGFNLFLPKPVGARELLEAATALLSPGAVAGSGSDAPQSQRAPASGHARL